jgi:hypothetical protein
MQTAVAAMIKAIVFVVQVAPLGTNISLARLLWAMMQGSFLVSRGAVHSGLQASDFAMAEIRRSWSALRYGCWEIDELLASWQVYVASQNQWRARRYGRYRVKSVDITAFWRPHLSGAVSKHYHSLAQKALPAIVFGVIISSGAIGGKRVPLVQAIVRCPSDKSEGEFRRLLLQEASKQTQADEVTVVDAGFALVDLYAAQTKGFVIRMARNCTARLNQLPQAKGKGRPCTYGTLVRPLGRRRLDHTLTATPAHSQGSFLVEGRTIRYASWHTLVTTTTAVHPDNPTFTLHVFSDPLYDKPLVLATDLTLAAELIYLIYRDRWSVEHPPLAAKQMSGLHRQFVSTAQSCFRLPELALLAGNILTHTAAHLPPIPSGFWDRTPQPTPGRLRRLLARTIFPNLTHFAPELRKKNSVSDHLPKGVDAHRRHKLAL